MSHEVTRKNVRVIGGGLSGLFAAYALTKKGFNVEIFEKSGRLGGLVQSLRLPWGLVETAANAMLASGRVEELSEDIGVEFCEMQKNFRRRYIYRGKPRQLPLSNLEAMRFSVGLFRRLPPQAGETLADYSQRTFGLGATQYLIEPAVMGVFGADAMRLSANLVYDYFFKFRSKKGSRLKGSVAPEKGMGAAVEGLDIWLRKKGVKVHLGTAGTIDENCRNVVCTDAAAASDLLAEHIPSLAAQLKHVHYQSLYSVTVGFSEPGNLKGFGCLFPRAEGFHSMGVLFNSYIFAGRGPCYTETWIAPAQDINGRHFNENEVFELVLADRKKAGGFGSRESPQHKVVTHWAQALPVYDTALERTLRSLSLPPYISLLGNYTGRMGLTKILDQAFEL